MKTEPDRPKSVVLPATNVLDVRAPLSVRLSATIALIDSQQRDIDERYRPVCRPKTYDLDLLDAGLDDF